MQFKKLIPTVIILIVLLISNTRLVAQCAMCKSSVESTLKTGGGVAGGLNNGILYLMGIPYIILMVGGYFFFKKPIDAKIKAWKEKRFPSKQRV